MPGSGTADFLEDALARLGLNRAEANEFIIYWLPLMQENAYNLIAFQHEAYTKAHASPSRPSRTRSFASLWPSSR